MEHDSHLNSVDAPPAHHEVDASQPDHEAIFPPPSNGSEPVTEEKKDNKEVIATVATIAVVGVGVALVSVELLPAVLLGAAAAIIPGMGDKWRPWFKKTVKASYSAVRKTREMVAEAGEHIQDAIAEAKTDKVAPIPTPDAAAPVPPASTPASGV
jgi:hypothetical protein